MSSVRITCFMVAALGVLASPSHGQTGGPSEGRMEAVVSGGLLGGAALGTSDANLRAGGPGAAMPQFRVFTVESEFGRTPLFAVHASYLLTRRLAVEGGLTWGRPELRGRVTADAEGAPSIEVAESVDQYFFDGRLLVAVPELLPGRRAVPFVVVGAGYLRQLHEGRTVIEHGEVYHAGGGFKFPLVTPASGLVRMMGVRGEMRAYWLRRGVSFETGPRPHLAVSGGVFVRF